MDLVAGARRVVVMMTHRTREGESKILRRCRLPLTGVGVVDRVITDMAVIDVTEGGLVLREIAPGLTVEGVVEATEATLTPAPGGDRAEEVRVAQQILQSLGIRSFSPQVTACPGCGRTTSTFFQEMAEQIQSYLREQMPVWKERYSGVEEMKVAVMGCVVNGPGESKHANLGISLPGTFEEPKAPVYVDGRLFTTLRGDRIVAEFIKILDRYVESHYADVGAGVPARAV